MSDWGSGLPMILALFAVCFVGGVTFEHCYCPGRSSSCSDGSAALGLMDHSMTWSLELAQFSGGLGHSLRYFSDYYCCCVHDFSKNHAGCKHTSKARGRDAGKAALLG